MQQSLWVGSESLMCGHFEILPAAELRMQKSWACPPTSLHRVLSCTKLPGSEGCAIEGNQSQEEMETQGVEIATSPRALLEGSASLTLMVEAPHSSSEGRGGLAACEGCLHSRQGDWKIHETAYKDVKGTCTKWQNHHGFGSCFLFLSPSHLRNLLRFFQR